MCGINVNGENRFIISPEPGGHFTYAKAEYKSIFGTVKSGWIKEDGKYIYEIEIPANCTADVILPDGNFQTLFSGKHIIK